MAVRSSNPAALMRPGPIITASIIMLRIIAFALLLMSTFGNYVTFVGGWDHLSTGVRWPMVLLSIAYQVVFSVLQWGMKALRWWFVYALALLASAVPSFLTYNAWAGPYLSVHIGTVLAALLVGLASIGADALPEWVLIA